MWLYTVYILGPFILFTIKDNQFYQPNLQSYPILSEIFSHPSYNHLKKKVKGVNSDW